jgi:hypothetical protein
VDGFGRFGEHDPARRAGFPRGKRCLFLFCSILLQPLSDVKD